MAVKKDFNTSHVTVYQFDRMLDRQIRSHFNTSHVTVYQISKLYFMFSTPFQYISCYGLSDNFVHNFLFLSNFNTSHVTVYRRLCGHIPEK